MKFDLSDCNQINKTENIFKSPLDSVFIVTIIYIYFKMLFYYKVIG